MVTTELVSRHICIAAKYSVSQNNLIRVHTCHARRVYISRVFFRTEGLNKADQHAKSISWGQNECSCDCSKLSPGIFSLAENLQTPRSKVKAPRPQP